MLDPTPLLQEEAHPVLPELAKDLMHQPKHRSRTSRPTKYYLIDFGLSKRYDPANGPPRDLPIFGGDKTVPEFRQFNDLHDPFPTDVYYLGNILRRDFLQVRR